MKITKDIRLIDVEEFQPFVDYLMYKVGPVETPAKLLSFQELHNEQPTWSVEGMVNGAARLRDVARQRQVCYDVYAPEECDDDPEKADVKLFYLPAEQQPSDKPFILAIAGGGYACVCSIVEALPAAAQFNALGYNVFVLNYRVNQPPMPNVPQPPLLPKPIDDVAAALNYILAHKDSFSLRNLDYIVNGYSAGGSITDIWGTERQGYAKYGLPKPKALFPIYSFISFDTLATSSIRDELQSFMFGSDADPHIVDAFDVAANITDGFPPCYAVHARDDDSVPVRNTLWLKELLDSRGIPVHAEIAEHGGHGWGDGSGSDADGWPVRAIQFVESL